MTDKRYTTVPGDLHAGEAFRDDSAALTHPAAPSNESFKKESGLPGAAAYPDTWPATTRDGHTAPNDLSGYEGNPSDSADRLPDAHDAGGPDKA